ncbi:MAG TPA: DNA damage-inducible protein D [Ktedonobacteraceae bacterium]|nr:DNA damage-inducible protein D [Ktedonobacteraceae bacterium]
MSNDSEGTQGPHRSPFEAIRRESSEYGEYWSARELYKLLGYSRWEKFKIAIERAEEACKDTGQAVSDHFHLEVKMVTLGSGAKRKVEDIFLSRYACYLTLQNADPSGKPIVGLAQSYFAVQTRRQELADELAELPEDQLRLMRRSQMSVLNNQLAEAAQHAGVIRPTDFAIFQDHGYMGLYGGLKAKDIHARKNLRRNQEILDWMNSDELAANAFRASLAKQKIELEQIQGKESANQAHHQMGKLVRDTIKEAGATLPEEMPKPTLSIQQLQRQEQQRLEQGQQPSLFETSEE